MLFPKEKKKTLAQTYFEYSKETHETVASLSQKMHVKQQPYFKLSKYMINFALLYRLWQYCHPLLSLWLLPRGYSATASLPTYSVLCQHCCFGLSPSTSTPDRHPLPFPATLPCSGGLGCFASWHFLQHFFQVLSLFSSLIYYLWFLKTHPVSQSTFPISWFHHILITSVVMSTI